jgi:hypothetical protein
VIFEGWFNALPALWDKYNKKSDMYLESNCNMVLLVKFVIKSSHKITTLKSLYSRTSYQAVSVGHGSTILLPRGCILSVTGTILFTSE